MRNTKANLRLWFFTFLLLCACCFTAQAQWTQTPKPNVAINANCNGYLETLPSDYYSNTQLYPLLIFFEGIGETGSGSETDLQKLYNNGPPLYIKQGNFPSSFTVNGQAQKFIIFSPQIVVPYWQRYPTPQEVNGIIDYAVQHYRVNTNKIYLMGISSGAYMAWEYPGYSSTYANRIAAILPFSGTSTPTQEKARNIASANVAVWAFCNKYDDGVPPSLTIDYVNLINQPPAPTPPAKLTLVDKPNDPHDSWYDALACSYTENGLNVYQWMLQFSRNAAPPPPPPNQPPTANAGLSQTITLPANSVTLNGSGSDPDGFIASYAWSKISGPAQGTINSPSSASTSVTGLAQGSYVFRLTIKDNGGLTATSDVTISVIAATNQPPTVSAGADKTITLPVNSVTLNGSASDADGTIASYSWSKVSGPSGSSFSSSTSASTTVNGLVQGSYTFRLTATDNGGASSSDDVMVTVNASVPASSTMHIEAEDYSSMSGIQTETTYDAGGGRNVGWIDNGDWMEYSINPSTSGSYSVKLRIATPNNGAQLQIKSSNGTVLSTVNLPNTGAYQSWQTTTTTINLSAGAQTIRIQSSAAAAWNINWLEFVSGGSGGTTNQPPTANAGISQTITLPANSVQLSGSASDADGSIASYSWTKVSGGSATIASPTSASTMVSGLVQGSYVFRLTVTDNQGATATSDVTITVNPGTSSGESTTKIEAENYSSMSGVQTETVYDEGGGKNVGWIDLGDWMEYSINPSTSGSYTVKFRVATPNNGAQFQVKSSSGTVLATVNLPNTGAYQSWQTTSANINLSAGVQTIRIQSSAQPAWNINWLEITGADGSTPPPPPPPPPVVSSRIEAESYTAMSGIQTETVYDAGGGLNVGWIDNGDWMDYSVTVASSGSYTLNFRVATPNSGAQLQVKNSGGSVLATVSLPNTGAYQSWQTTSATVTLIAGTQTIRLQSSAQPFWNINWLEIAQSGSAAVTAASTRTLTEQQLSAALSLFPNPVQDHFTLRVDNGYEGKVEVDIISLGGAVVKQFSFAKQKGVAQKLLPVGELAKGNYVVRVKMKEWNQTTQLSRQ